MRAIVLRAHGGPEQLRLEAYPDPVAQPGDVLVRVRACGLNNLDTQIRRGIPGVAIAMPHVLGCDIAGEVVALGPQPGLPAAGALGAAVAVSAALAPAARPLQTGDRVIVCPGSACGRCRACLTGNDSACPQYVMLGYQRHGGYAELVRVPARSVLRVSDRWSWEEWASVPLVFLTAWHMLIGRARLQPGETVLVHAAGSGVGIAAIQIAQVAGARVIATAGSDAKLERARQLGAHAVVSYARPDWHKDVRRHCGGEGVDVVLEHVGADTWSGSLASLARGGRLVTCGATSGPHVGIDLRHLFVKQLTLLGSYMGAQHELLRVVELLERSQLRPVVDGVFPLEEAAQAHERVGRREHFGKVVLRV